MFKIKLPTKRVFQIFPVLRINGMATFCNLFIRYGVITEQILLWTVQLCVQYKDGEVCVRHRILRQTSLYSTCIYGNHSTWSAV